MPFFGLILSLVMIGFILAVLDSSPGGVGGFAQPLIWGGWLDQMKIRLGANPYVNTIWDGSNSIATEDKELMTIFCMGCRFFQSES